MKEFIESVIRERNYILSEMEERIQKMYVLGKLTAAEMTELLEMAAEYADDTRQIDIPTVLADLERRIEVLEAAGIVVWTNGHVTARGETVLFDVIHEGHYRYCRYDGGRASTSLSPGKINGWVVLSGAGGSVTHTIEKDSDGNIILVPVEPQE